MSSKLCKLRTAIINDDLNEVTKIIEYNPDINLEATNFCNENILKIAINRKNSNISKFLISKAKFIININDLFIDILNWANVDLIELMIQKGANINQYGNYDKFPLFQVKNRPNDVIRYMINNCNRESLSKMGTKNYSMLDRMIETDNFEMVKLLVEKKVPITTKTTDGFNSIYIASFNGNFEMIKLLFESLHIPKYDPTTYSPIYNALKDGKFEIAEYLIDKGYGLNQSEEFDYKNCYNLATLVIQKNRLDLLDKILEKDVNPKLLNKQSPLFEAIKIKNRIERESVIRKLVAKGYSLHDPISPAKNAKPVIVYVKTCMDCTLDDYVTSKQLNELFEELFPSKYKEFKGVNCFDEIEYSDADIMEFMKSPDNIIIKNNDNFKGYSRKYILEYIQKTGTLYSQEKILNSDINHLKNNNIRFYDLINTGGKDCILVPYSDAIFIKKYAPKTS
jgi:ankyrin repeat protein